MSQITIVIDTNDITSMDRALFAVLAGDAPAKIEYRVESATVTAAEEAVAASDPAPEPDTEPEAEEKPKRTRRTRQAPPVVEEHNVEEPTEEEASGVPTFADVRARATVLVAENKGGPAKEILKAMGFTKIPELEGNDEAIAEWLTKVSEL